MATPQELARSELQKRSTYVGQDMKPFESTINPFNPNFRASVGSAIREFIDDFGFSGGYKQGLENLSDATEFSLDFIPGVGDAVGVGDLRQSISSGDRLGMGIDGAAVALGTIPIAGDLLAKGLKKGESALRGIDAWHGSPHRFNNFSMSNIGTGEGAQAYGHGLYFAENKGVSENYAKVLGDDMTAYQGAMDDVNRAVSPYTDFQNSEYMVNWAYEGGYDPKKESLYDFMVKEIDEGGYTLEEPDGVDIQGILKAAQDPEVIKATDRMVMPVEPTLYNVNLNVEPDELLDWDAPLGDQSEAVKNALREGGIDVDRLSELGHRGETIYGKFVGRNAGGGAEASAELASLGIPGIRYLDGTSRSAGEGTRNFVMFDDSLIDTKRVNDKLTPSWMEQGARMQRAQDLGFDTRRTAYRGLRGEYDPSKAGNYQMFTSSPEDASEYGSNVVSSYLRKGNNLVVDGGRNNFNSIPVDQLPDDVKANLHSSVGSVARTDDIAYAAQAAGYDSVSINNVFDKASNEIPLRPSASNNEPLSQEMMDFLDEVNASGMLDSVPNVDLSTEIPRNYDPTTIDIIFDPKNIRSIEAEFDPAKVDSSNLLSGIQPTRSALAGIA